jgi:hypothetical protein
LYYLQSRYYNPTWGRFINADALVSTGQGILGNNMFVYCLNNPVNFLDSEGSSAICVTNGDRNPLMIGHIGLGGGGAGGGSGMHADSGMIAYISGQKKITDVPIVDNALAGNKIRSGITNLNNAKNMLLIPDPSPLNDVLAVATGVYGIIKIVWGITDLLIPAENE